MPWKTKSNLHDEQDWGRFVDLIGCITYTEASQGMREVGTVVKEANKTKKISRKMVIQFPY